MSELDPKPRFDSPDSLLVRCSTGLWSQDKLARTFPVRLPREARQSLLWSEAA